MAPPLPAYQSPMMVATQKQQQQAASMKEAAASTTSSLRLPLKAAHNKANEGGGDSVGAASSNRMEMVEKNKEQTITNKNATSAATVWEYPLGVPLPNKALLRSLYQTAMNSSNDSFGDDGTTRNDQQAISDFGLLSMEDVLLPAMAYQEERALKQIQAVVQRDCPNHVQEVVHARKAVYDATRAAVQACQTNRLQQRLPQQAAREKVWHREQELKLQEIQQQEAQQQRQAAEIRMQARERRRQERRDKHPVNQELWREVAYLMTEMHHLEKEERLWKEAAASLSLQQQEQQEAEQQAAGAVAAITNHQSNEDAMDVDVNNDSQKEASATATTTTETVLETIDSITLSSVRVERSLQMVADMMQQSDALRSEIYRRHEAERFRGYPGEREPKDLIRLLSQD
jgi:hypothetical protein